MKYLPDMRLGSQPLRQSSIYQLVAAATVMRKICGLEAAVEELELVRLRGKLSLYGLSWLLSKDGKERAYIDT